MSKVFWMVFGCLIFGMAQADRLSQDMPQQVVINGVEFVHIPAGWVQYPIPDLDPRTAEMRHDGMRMVKVWIDSYYMAVYEARARDFMRFMTETKPTFSAHYDSPVPGVTGVGAADGCSVRKNPAGEYYLRVPEVDYPVTHLSWDLANEFTLWMGFRLPSEAEWVRAFRGDDMRIFPWGNEYPDDTYAGFEEGATECNVQPVTAFPKGRSPFGVYNMAGNVFEYVADWFNLGYYDTLKDGARNPLSTEPYIQPDEMKPLKVLRGGRWASGVGELMIYGNRDLRVSDAPFRCYGARFAIDETMVKQQLETGNAQIVKQ